MTDKILGVCILGCGMMGTIHANCWSSQPDTRIISICDLIEDRTLSLAKQHDLPACYQDYRQAIDHPGVDVVSVCVPTYLHAEMSIYAARRGKHVLSEKPIALTLEDAQAMIDAAEQNNVRLGVGFMRRHTPVLTSLRDLVQSGGLGRPLIYHAGDIRQIRPKLAMHDIHQNGGPVIDMGVHLYDVWGEIFQSTPVEVFAQGMVFGKGRPELASIQDLAVDSAAIQVRYASGDLGIFVVSWGLPPAANPADRPDQIYGPGGMGEVVFGVQYQHLHLLREGGEWATLAACEYDMYQSEIAAMRRHILDAEPFPADGPSGIEALRVGLAAIESIRSGQPVAL